VINTTEQRRRYTVEEWTATRRFLRADRWSLTKAAASLYPTLPRVAATTLLARPEWLPAAPVPLETVALTWSASPDIRGTALHESARCLLPVGQGVRVATYAEAVLAIDRPHLLEDRPTYRITAADLAGTSPRFEFGPGTYFDVLNVGEASAHEYAQIVYDHQASTDRALPLRALVGDPTDPTRRPMLTAFTVLTLRYDRARDDARFLVHWRDPAKVATNGGYYQVTPVGMFQPAGTATPDGIGDFDLWRGIAREYSEELLAAPEHEDVDYERWPFFQELSAARTAGTCRPYLLGMGVDPLSLAADVLVVTMFEADTFDALFAGLVEENAEGRTEVRGNDGLLGTPFTEETVRRLVDTAPMQPAGAAVLDLAWRHRDAILSS
jgi:hypothetical protein